MIARTATALEDAFLDASDALRDQRYGDQGYRDTGIRDQGYGDQRKPDSPEASPLRRNSLG